MTYKAHKTVLHIHLKLECRCKLFSPSFFPPPSLRRRSLILAKAPDHTVLLMQKKDRKIGWSRNVRFWLYCVSFERTLLSHCHAAKHSLCNCALVLMRGTNHRGATPHLPKKVFLVFDSLVSFPFTATFVSRQILHSFGDYNFQAPSNFRSAWALPSCCFFLCLAPWRSVPLGK